MPVGVQCPFSSSLGEFPSYWDWLCMVSWAFARIGVHRPSLRFPYLVFPFALFCHWISIVFLLYGRRIATHSVDPSLTHFLGEFPGLGLALVPRCCGPRGGQRCAWNRKLDPNFCSGRGRTSNRGIRLPRIPPFSRLLRHAGGYSRTINSNPEPVFYCAFNVGAVSVLVAFLLDIVDHMTTRRGPDVARGPDAVH